MEYKIKPSEDLDSWKLRLCRNKDLYDITWSEIAELWFEETSDKKSGDWFRKFFRYYEQGYQDGIKENTSNEDMSDEMEEKRLLFEKEKVKFQDQKREYFNLIKNGGRFDHLREEIHKTILEVGKQKPLIWSEPRYNEFENKTGILLLSDWHVGSEFSNSFNKYNVDIFKSRTKIVVEKAIKDGKRNNIEKLIVANLGDALQGIIHVSTRVMSDENVIRQIKIAAEMLAEIICKLANEFKQIKFININGNHSRVIGNKSDAIPKENMEQLIFWYLETRLAHIKNLDMVSEVDGYVLDNIYGKNVVFVHGDLDHLQGCVKSLPQMLGIVPHLLLCGHVHHNSLKEHGITTVISNGSLMGSDDYAISKRYFAKPSQKMIILSEYEDDEIHYTYNLK